MSVSVAVFHLSQHIQSVKRQASGDGGAGDATIRKIQYRIMGLCSALLLLLLLLYLVCRYGGTKLHIAAALCRRLCGHSLPSLSLAPSPCAAFGVRVLSFFFVF